MENYRMFRAALAIALLALATGRGRAAESAWQVLRFEGRDYLSVENMATFYGFPTVVPPVSEIIPANPAQPILSKKVALENARQQVEVTLKSREVLINGVKQLLSFPIEELGDKLIVSRLDLARVFEPMLRPEMIKELRPVQTVVLDPGHGGHDRGATSIFGDEKDFALDVCRRAKPLLEGKGIKVVMTRSTDVFIPLEQRPRMANAIPNSVFVAVHFNCAPFNPSASGFEIFSITPRGGVSSDTNELSIRDLRNEPGNSMETSSAALSASIYHSMLGNLPLVDRGIKHQRFAVIRRATVPAVLVEGGFVTNAAEVRLIATPAWRQKLAESIVTGIGSYKALAELKIPPKLVADYRKMAPENLAAEQSPSVVTNSQAAPSEHLVPPVPRTQTQ